VRNGGNEWPRFGGPARPGRYTRPVPLLVAVVLLALAPSAYAGTWHWPVRGEVVKSFALGANPYAGGQHRGIDIAAVPGTSVRAACAGHVRFAGRVPRAGRTVSVRCGALVATYLHLGAIRVRRGEDVTKGERIGTTAGPIHLGARRAASRHGYVDPLTLLEADPLGPGPPALPLTRPRPLPPTASPAPLPARVPRPAWAGLALLGLAVPGLALVAAGRRRRRTRAAAGLAPREASR
jgi:Peptidase family M23